MNKYLPVIFGVALSLISGAFVDKAEAFDPRTARAALAVIGESAALREVVETIGAKSPALAALAKELGISIGDKAKLLHAFDSLSAYERGAIALHDTSLSEAMLSSSRFKANAEGQLAAVASFNELKFVPDVRRGLPRWASSSDDYFFIDHSSGEVISGKFKDRRFIVASGTPTTNYDLGAGELTFARPIQICREGICSISISKIKAPDITTAVTGGASAAAGACYTSPCLKWAKKSIEDLLATPKTP